MDGFDDHVRDRWLAQVERAIASLIQEPIHGGKRLPGGERIPRESSVGRKSVVETPGKENRMLGV